MEYTPYGETWIEKSDDYSNMLPYKFTAKELDDETGLYYYGARYLNPRISRWISTDPALEDYLPVAPIDDEAKKHNQNLPGMGGVFNPVNLNLYHYAGNNPVKYNDPTGESTTLLGAGIGAAVGGISGFFSSLIQKTNKTAGTIGGLVGGGVTGGLIGSGTSVTISAAAGAFTGSVVQSLTDSVMTGSDLDFEDILKDGLIAAGIGAIGGKTADVLADKFALLLSSFIESEGAMLAGVITGTETIDTVISTFTDLFSDILGEFTE